MRPANHAHEFKVFDHANVQIPESRIVRIDLTLIEGGLHYESYIRAVESFQEMITEAYVHPSPFSHSCHMETEDDAITVAQFPFVACVCTFFPI